MNPVRNFSALALSLLIAGCMQPSVPSGDSPSSPGSGAKSTQESDWAAIVALEDQAKALAKTTGCASSSECRSAPVGNRACGGPRYYIAYCVVSTDSVALFRKLDEVKSAENAFNTKYKLVSTCEFRIPPQVGIVNSVCALK